MTYVSGLLSFFSSKSYWKDYTELLASASDTTLSLEKHIVFATENAHIDRARLYASQDSLHEPEKENAVSR